MDTNLNNFLKIDQKKLIKDYYYKHQQIDNFINILISIDIKELDELIINKNFIENTNSHFLSSVLLGVVDRPEVFKILFNHTLKYPFKNKNNYLMILNSLNENNFNQLIPKLSPFINGSLQLEEESVYPRRGFLTFIDDIFVQSYSEQLKAYYSFKHYIYIHKQPSKIQYFLNNMCFSQIKNMLFERFVRKDFESIVEIANSKYLYNLYSDEDINIYFEKEEEGSKIKDIFNKLILNDKILKNIEIKRNEKIIFKI